VDITCQPSKFYIKFSEKKPHNFPRDREHKQIRVAITEGIMIRKPAISYLISTLLKIVEVSENSSK
jgi:hypothetical protein